MTKKLLLCLFLTASGAVAVPGDLLAQGDDMYDQGRWLVGADGGTEVWTNETIHNVVDDHESDVTNFGLRVGYALGDNLTAELAWNRIDEDFDGIYELRSDVLSLGLVHHWLDGSFRPFVGGGLGLGTAEDTFDDEADLWNVYGQVGISFVIGEQVALDLSHTLRYLNFEDERDSLGWGLHDDEIWRTYGLIRVGISYSF